MKRKASKESDVDCFGVVTFEIACERKSVDPKQELRKVRLVEWVWDLYGKGEIMGALDWKMTAADGGRDEGLDSEQVERSSGNIGAGKKGFRRSAGTTARKPMVGRGRPLKLDEEIDGIRCRWV
ncbi:L-type lectin-domain containing receptor kinase IX.1 [Linum perenne]